MSDHETPTQTSLEARNPFELRVDLGRNVPESDVRSALATGEMGFLHSFTTGSTVDGPGVRVVAWTAGCMWRCLYCHNPDTWTMTNGIPVTVAKAAEELRKYRTGLKIMSGGLTISGGEPLMQHRFVVKLLTAAKAMGVHTTIETNGYYGDRLTDPELESVDLVMLGIKTWDPERHRRLTGMELEPTLAFARRLAAQKRKIWVRFVLVPGLTDDAEDIANIARFAAGLGTVERVETAMALSVPPLEPPAHVRQRVLAEARKPVTYTVWAADAAWIDTGLPGIRARVLAVDKARSLVTLLIRAKPGAVYPSHKHHGPEECFVISGSVVIDGRVLRAGDFHHADEDSDHGEITTAEGAEVFIVGAIADYLPAAAAPAEESGRFPDR